MAFSSVSSLQKYGTISENLRTNSYKIIVRVLPICGGVALTITIVVEVKN